jgi:peroxiredoxin
MHNTTSNTKIRRGGDSAAGEEYRFDRLTTGLAMRDMYYPSDAPRPGDQIPDFDMPTTDGGRFSRGDLAEKAATLLVFGSYSCPVTESSANGLRSLHAEFGDRVRFVMVNVREAHPGEYVDQPQTLDEKHDHATTLRGHHGFEFTVATDNIDGSLHRAMSPKPNSAYLLDTEGTILFRAHWANDTNGLRQAITTVTSGQRLVKTESRALVGPMLRVIGYIDPILETAGPRSRRDMWRAAPPMAMLSKLTGLFPFLRRDRRGVAAVALSMTTLAATIVILALLA